MSDRAMAEDICVYPPSQINTTNGGPKAAWFRPCGSNDPDRLVQHSDLNPFKEQIKALTTANAALVQQVTDLRTQLDEIKKTK